MPRYYFAVHSTDGRKIDDDEGIELPNDAAARAYALEAIEQLNQEEPEAFMGWSIEVAADDGRIATRLPFQESN
jgi:hypothetical protein